MNLLVDTSVWSLAFRRDGDPDAPQVVRLREALVAGERIVTTGVVVQELLQGFNGPRQREALIDRLASLPFLRPTLDDHVEAADLRNRCRRKGVQLATIDALIAALCRRYELTLLTTDGDFDHAAAIVPFRRWRS